jgi:hypothetical protein
VVWKKFGDVLQETDASTIRAEVNATRENQGKIQQQEERAWSCEQINGRK